MQENLMATTAGNKGALTAIDELRIDSKIGKSKHFNASDRKLFWHRFYGVPVIVANLFVGIVLVSLQGAKTPVTTEPSTVSQVAVPGENSGNSKPMGQVIGSNTSSTPAETRKNVIVTEQLTGSSNNFLGLFSIFLAFAAASLSAIQTFFNFHKASEGHRAIGNRYVHISRQCKGLQQKHRDVPFSAESLWAEYEKLYAEYHQINTEAETFPTNSDDLAKAKAAAEISPYKAPLGNV
jgi:hypothetical protein